MEKVYLWSRDYHLSIFASAAGLTIISPQKPPMGRAMTKAAVKQALKTATDSKPAVRDGVDRHTQHDTGVQSGA